MKIATAMIDGRSTKKAITISPFSRLRCLTWVGEAARPRSPETVTVLFAKCCFLRRRHQRRLGCGDIAAREHVVERQVIVQQEALLGGGAMLQATYQRVALPVFHRRKLVFVIQALIGVGA